MKYRLYFPPDHTECYIVWQPQFGQTYIYDKPLDKDYAIVPQTDEPELEIERIKDRIPEGFKLVEYKPEKKKTK